MESESVTVTENTLNIVKREIPVAKSIEEHDGFKFNILLRRQTEKTLGCDVAWDTRERNFAILSIHSEGLLADWNRDNDNFKVLLNDRVVCVNDHYGVENSSEMHMYEEVHSAVELNIQIFRPPSREALPEYGWEYIDIDKTIKGPFSRLEMRVRNKQGNFYSGTPLRFDSNDKFMPLSELFPDGTAPFVTAVSRRNKSTEPPEQMQLSAQEFYGEIEIDPVDTMKRAGILDSTFSVPSLFPKESYAVFTNTSLCSEDLPGVERLVAWAELTDTLLFYYLWCEGFHAPDACVFFANENWNNSSETWIYAWLSNVVSLNYMQINRFLTVCSSTVWM